MENSQPGKYTRNEILSQPKIWASELTRIESEKRIELPSPEEFDQILFTGCGSPFFLSRWAARECELFTKVFSRAVPASDLLLEPGAWVHDHPKTLLVASSRSAHTTETIRTVKEFQQNGGKSLVITCYPENELSKLTPHVVALPEGQEESVAQTRSFTSMMLGIASWLNGGVPGGFPASLEAAGSRLIAQYSELADRLGMDQSIQRFFFLGSGARYGLANELMLKMKEMSLSYSESFHFLEFRHGPMSMVDDSSLVIGLMNVSDNNYELDLLRDMKKIGARTLAICEDKEIPNNIADATITLQSGLPPLWRAPLYLPIPQLIACERALVKKLNPDRPNNLEAVVVLDE
jgi:glucosamine--fructose-6-phosphate aminotransferase (isomerizing)